MIFKVVNREKGIKKFELYNRRQKRVVGQEVSKEKVW